jgi:transposase
VTVHCCCSIARSEGTKSSRNSIFSRQRGTGLSGQAAPAGQSQSSAPDEAEFVGCDQTIYGWFRRWLGLGLFDALLREMARRRRRTAGRRPGPSSGIIDAQVVTCIAVRGPRGCDAAKGVVGRKRVALVDAEGHWLAVAVVPASVQDRDVLEALDAGKARWPTLREGVYDGAFAAERCRAWSNVHGMRHRVVARDPATRGFVVLARRWVVERSFGWLSHGGGLAKDRAGRLDVSAARLALACVLSGMEALLNPMPIRAPE